MVCPVFPPFLDIDLVFLNKNEMDVSPSPPFLTFCVSRFTGYSIFPTIPIYIILPNFLRLSCSSFIPLFHFLFHLYVALYSLCPSTHQLALTSINSNHNGHQSTISTLGLVWFIICNKDALTPYSLYNFIVN